MPTVQHEVTTNLTITTATFDAADVYAQPGTDYGSDVEVVIRSFRDGKDDFLGTGNVTVQIGDKQFCAESIIRLCRDIQKHIDACNAYDAP